MANVRFFFGTKEQYLDLPLPREEVGLYFCTDTCELYRGDDLYTRGIKRVSVLPGFKDAADGMLYCLDNGNAYFLNEARDSWVQLTFTPIDDLGAIADEDVDKYVPTVGAVLKALENVTFDGITSIPVATATSIGGVKAVAKTDEMTQEIGIDEDGKLWAKIPDMTGVATEEYVDKKVDEVFAGKKLYIFDAGEIG